MLYRQHQATTRQLGRLVAGGVEVAQGEGAAVVGDASVEDHVVNVAKEGGTEALQRLLAHMPDKQAAILMVMRAAASKAACIERAVDASLTRSAYRTADRGCQRMPKRV